MNKLAERAARGRFAWRALERLILGRSRTPRASVLIFHRVLRERDSLRPNEPIIEEFETLIRFLADNFRVRLLREAVADVADGSDDGHSVAITFDDGYADNVDNALPVLRKYGVPATFFITSDTLETGVMW
ncbi:MAG TPA: polysaccharide deacetylase family protein, partial [Woeseiaceae bacterium]|nr:polysaccharide deacetylase family protein [Woeseiaceae bacterium]